MRVFGKVCAVALLALTAACGGGDGITEPASIAGTYNLVTIDGQSPPIVLFDEPGFKAEIMSGNFILAEGRTFTTNVVFRVTEGGQVSTESDSYDGTYTVTGSTVDFAYSDGDSASGTLNGNTLTFVDGGSTAVFRK